MHPLVVQLHSERTPAIPLSQRLLAEDVEVQYTDGLQAGALTHLQNQIRRSSLRDELAPLQVDDQ